MSRSRGSGRRFIGHREHQVIVGNTDQQAVEFGVEIGEDRGVVRIRTGRLPKLLIFAPHRMSTHHPIEPILADIANGRCGAS